MTGWGSPVKRATENAIRRGNASFGRAYATFLAKQVARLDQAFGSSRRERRTNPYRVAVRLLRSLGYSQREIAAMLDLSQSAVARLCKDRAS